MSSKAIPKRDPAEKLGAFGRVGGRLWVVEYSDLAPEQASRRRPDGSLVFGLGSPAMHVLNVAFVRRLTAQGPNLPLHVAEKAAALVDDQGRIAPAAGGNVRKFEMFVFDALPFAERSVIMEVRREDEFSPVKNAQGEDSPDTARRDMMDRWARWLQAAGAVVPRDESGRPKARIEISPLAALDADDLRSRVRPGTRIEGVFHLSA
jgi:UDP-N-acetylglucosamine/UDP-N-acetylgalactosamine diphosphorylase